MRALTLVLAIGLPLGACGQSNDAEAEREGPAMTANAISSNDITAIDAVTGEAANMAADTVIDRELVEGGNDAGNNAAGADRPRRPARSATSRTSRAAPASNQAAPAPDGNRAD